MSKIILVGEKHAECQRCGDVIHFPWASASSPDMAVAGWVGRLRQGCRECGGEIREVKIEACAECRYLTTP